MARYRELLDGVEGLTMPFGDVEGDEPLAPSRRRRPAEGADRDAIRPALAERGIQTSVHYPPIHGFTAYRVPSRRPLPQTDAVAERILTLPLYGGLTDEQVEAVIGRPVQTL